MKMYLRNPMLVLAIILMIVFGTLAHKSAGTDVTDMVQVICHHAVVDEHGIQSDVILLDYFVPADELDDFVTLKVAEDAADEASWKDLPPNDNYINRRLTRIRTAPVRLEAYSDDSDVTILKATQAWEAVWTYQEHRLQLSLR